MSAAALLLGRPDSYCPWRDLGRRTGVSIVWHSHAPTIGNAKDSIGVTHFDQLEISLRAGMSANGLRSTLAHELVHLERGPVESRRTRQEEASVELIAAKRLIDPQLFDELMSLRSEPTKAEIARVLGVDGATLSAYAGWRRRVKESTAQRAWESGGLRADAEAYPAWPPAWLQDARDGTRWETAARWAGVL